MSSEKKLFLLDGMALIYRAFFAFSQNPRITSYGLNASAMFGFTNTLLEIIKKEKPSHIAVVFDTSAPTERHDIFPEYKAHRDEMPEDLRKSIPYIFKIIEAFNIPVLTKEGYEADDIIGTLAKKAEKQGFVTYMMTPDKDFAQLVSEHIFMYKPARLGNAFEIMGVKEVLEKWEIQHVEQVIDILALWGDAADNIPGIPGIGEKTAKKLISEYGSVENIIANAHQLKGKQQENVINFAQQGLLSKKLATINLETPIELDEIALILDPMDEEKVRSIFTELEFKTLLSRLLGSSNNNVIQTDLFGQAVESGITQISENEIATELKTIESTKHNYQLCQSEKGIDLIISILSKKDSFCFDTETTSLVAIDAEIVGLSLSINTGEAWYIPFSEQRDKQQLMLNKFKPLFENEHITKIGQNIKYDYLILQNYNIEIKGPLFDTMLAHYLIEPDGKHSMDFLAQKYLSYQPVSIDSLIGKKGKDQKSFRDVDLQIAKEYAGEDADITLQLKHQFNPILDELELRPIFEDMECKLIPVLADMEREGVKIDHQFLNEYSSILSNESAQLEKEIYEIAGVKFNVASPKQLGEVLFDNLKLDPKAKKTKTGQYQTGEDVLSLLAHIHPLPAKILDYREVNKLKSTYVDALPLLVNSKTGRVHTSFNQAVAATGRLSSNNPNLQNIPIRTDKGKEIRKAFIAGKPNHVLLSADYSQIELRIIASVSNDKGMMDAFNQGLDIHTATASKVWGVPLSEVDQDMRRKAKTVNFGIIYGISAFGLSQRVNISRTEAKDIIDNYFNQFSGIKQYMDNTINFCREKGYVQTILGRKRFIRDINSANRTVVGFAERNAINAPIQGSAADMIKLAMIKVQHALKSEGLSSKMILQVHDELLFEVPEHEISDAQILIKREMEHAMPLSIPVIAESGYGKNWLEAH